MLLGCGELRIGVDLYEAGVFWKGDGLARYGTTRTKES